MQNVSLSLQSQKLFASSLTWHHLPAETLASLRLPSHLDDQAFHLMLANAGPFHAFEAFVSEQTPREAYIHIARALKKIAQGSFVLNVVHQRSSQGHLIFFDKQGKRAFYHLDVDFHRPSQLDRAVIELLNTQSEGIWPALISRLASTNTRQNFFKLLKHHLDQLSLENADQYREAVHLLLRLIFLVFVQRKNWLNFDPYYLQTKMAACHRKGLSILNCLLVPLFGRLEGFPSFEPLCLGELPSLGGGLFQFEGKNLREIPNNWFIELLKLTSSFSFSLYETHAERDVVGVSPEVLGHVFENLLAREDRKAQATFYTPQSLAEHQVKAAFEAYFEEHDYAQKSTGAKLKLLKSMHIFDPACGSGTFLVTAFQVLLQERLKLAPQRERYNGKLFELKRQIVCNNLFGLDINPMAVRLTEVRLWLNMIQDLEIAQPSKAPPLPNLQHHLRPGDFLFQSQVHIADIRAWPKTEELTKLRAKFPQVNARQRSSLLRHIHRLEQELQIFLDGRQSRRDLAQLRQQKSQMMLPGLPAKDTGKTGPRPKSRLGQLHLVFHEALLEGGFDLIIGNPPWQRTSVLPAETRAALQRYPRKPSQLRFRGQTDVSLYFLAAALTLLRPQGHLSFLLPGKWLQSRFGTPFRTFFQTHCRLNYLLDYGIDQDLVFKADTFPVVLGLTRGLPNIRHKLRLENHAHQVFESAVIHQHLLGSGKRAWRLASLIRPERDTVPLDWPLLGGLPWSVQRGVVTNVKRLFTFDDCPPMIDPKHLRPLLRGRDIQPGLVVPGKWIYWPFNGRADWSSCLSPEELAWLTATGKTKGLPPSLQLRYGPKAMGNWVVVWKYLAARMQAALVPAEKAWVCDQTTYFMAFEDFANAWRLYRLLNSHEASRVLSEIAERGKDRCFFYYAHTVRQLPYPPELLTCKVTSPLARQLLAPPSQPFEGWGLPLQRTAKGPRPVWVGGAA